MSLTYLRDTVSVKMRLTDVFFVASVSSVATTIVVGVPCIVVVIGSGIVTTGLAVDTDGAWMVDVPSVA